MRDPGAEHSKYYGGASCGSSLADLWIRPQLTDTTFLVSYVEIGSLQHVDLQTVISHEKVGALWKIYCSSVDIT